MPVTSVHKIDRLNLLQVLVAEAIPSLHWRHNGLGLLQGFIREPELRVHVWHPSLITKQAQYSKIHDHRFNLVSSVLLGTIYHTEQELVPNTTGKWQICVIDGSPKPSTQRYDIKSNIFAIAEGSYYTYPKGLFHSAHSVDLAVSLCEKHEFEPEKPVLGAICSQQLSSQLVHKVEQLTHNEILSQARSQLLTMSKMIQGDV